MPKYRPTYEDMAPGKPCKICGKDTEDDNADVCYSCYVLSKIEEDLYDWGLLDEPDASLLC